MDGLSTLSYTWMGRLLFRSIVLIFVEFGDGSERPGICCSVLTSTEQLVQVSTEQHMSGRSLPPPSSTKINTMLRNNNLPTQVQDSVLNPSICRDQHRPFSARTHDSAIKK